MPCSIRRIRYSLFFDQVLQSNEADGPGFWTAVAVQQPVARTIACLQTSSDCIVLFRCSIIEHRNHQNEMMQSLEVRK